MYERFYGIGEHLPLFVYLVVGLGFDLRIEKFIYTPRSNFSQIAQFYLHLHLTNLAVFYPDDPVRFQKIPPVSIRMGIRAMPIFSRVLQQRGDTRYLIIHYKL
jgi:hypothetical protein